MSLFIDRLTGKPLLAGEVQKIYAENISLPVIATQGYVNVSEGTWTGKFWAGQKVWQRTVRGYFPNRFSNIQNVNGVATQNLFATGSGVILSFHGYIDRGGFQVQLLQAGEGGATDFSHLAFVYQNGGIASTNKQVGLYNNHDNQDYNGGQFMIVINYLDSNIV